MREGAIAFLDALGFKGIWRHHDPPVVLSKLMKLARNAEAAQMPDPPQKTDEPQTFRRNTWVRFFSDTVIIGCRMETDLSPPDIEGASELQKLTLNSMALAWVTISAAAAIAAAADDDEPPLAYRGSISQGRFEAEDQFVVGPAVDEAAEAEKLARGAFVWYCPSALRCVSQARAGQYYGMTGTIFENLPIVLNYPVPLKGGDTIVSHVINPLLSGNRERLIQRMMHSFNSARIDVSVKRQNTEIFLRRAETEALQAERHLLSILSTLASRPVTSST